MRCVDRGYMRAGRGDGVRASVQAVDDRDRAIFSIFVSYVRP